MVEPPRWVDPDVDGGRLLRQAVMFGRTLRAVGLGVDLGAAIDFARALTLVDMGDREQVRAAGAAVFVRRRDEREPYDRAFDHFWRRRMALPNDLPPATMPDPEMVEPDEGEPGDGSIEAPGHRETLGRLEGLPRPGSEDEGDDDESAEGFVIAPDAYSAAEVLRHREFDRMTAAEMRDAERLIDRGGAIDREHGEQFLDG